MILIKITILLNNYRVIIICVFDEHRDDGEYVSKACVDFLLVYFRNYIVSKKNVNFSFE